MAGRKIKSAVLISALMSTSAFVQTAFADSQKLFTDDYAGPYLEPASETVSDIASQSPILNVVTAHGSEHALAGQRIAFKAYWNYDKSISQSVIRVFEASDKYLDNPIAEIPFSKSAGASWKLPDAQGKSYKYVLRVYSETGQYDETVAKSLVASATTAPSLAEADVLQSIYRVDDTAVRNIMIKRTIRLAAPEVAPTPVQTPKPIAAKAPAKTAKPIMAEPVLTPIKASLPQRPATRILVNEAVWQEASDRVELERRADQILDRADIRLSFDGLDAVPLLNVGTANGSPAVEPGETVRFDTYWNYSHWIDKAVIEVFDYDDKLIKAPIAKILVDPVSGQANWTVPATRMTTAYTYRLIVTDKDGRSDETVLKYLTVAAHTAKEQLAPGAASAVYGLDATATRNIDIRGGAVTVSGKSLSEQSAKTVKVLGGDVAVNKDGDFALQEILPSGEHSIPVEYVSADGTKVKTDRAITIPENDFFFVAIGDLTVGTRSSDSRALIEASGEDFEETYVTGRGAFYLKGKVQGKYLLTASMDTTEDDIDNLFSNLSKKNPQSLLRRLDPDRYYPVYGDNSTYVEDAPTQGRFYVRIEDGDDSAMWGNFLTNITNTEFAHIDRGLYGGKVSYNSDELTDAGERRFQTTVFAADPGTIPAREEYRATGGSVYFLERQDLTIGSERLRVEIRDQDSGLVMETRDLKPYVDYGVDYIQGRIILSAPLSSTALGDQIVRDGTLSGGDVYLVVRYEYTPTLEDVDGFTTGGRVQGWLNDSARIGLTAQTEETGDADQSLMAVDALIRKSDQTYFKAELAQTDGPGFGERASIDGGFNFDLLSASNTDEATAWRLEGAADIAELTGSPARTKITGYYEMLDDGFAGVGRLTQGDTERYGASLFNKFGERGSLALKFDDVSIDGGVAETTAAGDVRFGVAEKLTAGIGLRYNDVTGSAFGEDGLRTDLGVEVRYDRDEAFAVYGFAQGTLEAASGRDEANRAGFGVEAQLMEQLSLRGEVSGGDGGTGALTEATWTRAEGEEYYLNYALDAERTEPGVDGNNFLSNSQNTLTGGGRKRFNDIVSVYGEERASFGDTTGLTHAYGLDFNPTEQWAFGASFEIGTIEEMDQRVEREAYTVTAGYADEELNFGAAFEWRDDKEGGNQRETWLFRSNLGLKVSPDWTAILKYNKAESNFSGGSFFDGEFTELQIGGAYRPTKNNRFNGLIRYTYFEDLPTASQISDSGQSELPAQKSNIFNADANYRLTDWVTIGGKFGLRHGEVSLSRTDEDFVESTATLGVLRADVHVIKKWDALIEGRILDVDAAGDTKAGFLAAIYRHVGDNAKVGIGYNFTDFSDDLTDLSFNDDGVFLNIIAKF